MNLNLKLKELEIKRIREQRRLLDHFENRYSMIVIKTISAIFALAFAIKLLFFN